MTKSGIGFVIQANAEINKENLERLLRVTDSPKTSHTVLNNPEYANYLKSIIAPQSNIYCRNYDNDGDENDWKQYTPQAYFDKYGWQTRDGLGLQVANEPGFGKDILDRLIEFMLEAERRNIKVSIGGFSVGTTPDNPNGWAQYDNFVQQLCRRPDLFCLDAHEYGLVVPTSGMVTADTKPGEVLYFTTALFRKDQWTKSFADVTNAYHIGRIRHLMDYCKSKGYKFPTVDIGECPIDFVSDQQAINDWGKALPHTNPNPVIQHVRGYKSMGRVWPEQVAPGQSIQQTNMDVLEWMRDIVYAPLGVRSMRVFTYGNSGYPPAPTDWQDFDWNTDKAMQDVFYSWATAGTIPTPPPPVEPPPIPPYEPSFAQGDNVIMPEDFTPYGTILEARWNNLDDEWEYKVSGVYEPGSGRRETWHRENELKLAPPDDEPLPQPDFKAYVRAALADTMENLRTAKEQLASAVDTLNRLEEAIDNEL